MPTLTLFSFISLAVLCIVYIFLITEKINKVIVAILGAALLIVSQVFPTTHQPSQDTAFGLIS
ncbi:MAG TPA: hypothetical protein PKJ26_02300, partial [Candidatus Woesebacteria bacterium]|nr:hypothetical protein [Candidatus Woesebacteria bacterium]